MAKARKAASRDAAEARTDSRYEARKERERKRQARMSAEGRDIAPMPKCRRPAERKKCEASLKYFALHCFPSKFGKTFSKDHLQAIQKMEDSIVNGALFALSMPRGSGKTTLIVVAVMWAILCGHRGYIALIGPTAAHARKMLRTIKVELEHNDELLDLFPEACWPFRCLQNKANKCGGQLYNGRRTCIEWGKDQICFASIDNAKCSGAIIETAGLTGSIRGMQYPTADGETRRPDLVVIDDPQTKRSAKSDTQCQDRLETIQGDVLGLAGPGESIAGFLLCTVIRKGDVADQLLDRELHPEWYGYRCKLIYEWPKNEELWDQYAQIRAEELQAGRGIEAATEFYRKNRKAMDAGSKVAWEERFRDNEISALQHVYNLLLRDEVAFWAEFQNEPKDDSEDTELLTVDQITMKLSGYGRGVVPPEADTLTAFIDVQGKILYWLVAAWKSDNFSGWVLDWGAWPDQGLAHFTLSGARKTLAKKYPRMGIEGRTRAGLQDLVDHLIAREFRGPDDATHRLRRIGIDAGWGETSKVVQQFCREHDHASILIPCFGRGITPTQAPIESWKKVDGERRGLKLVIRPTKGGGRHLLADTNYWKTFIHNRLSTAIGDPGALCLPKPTKREANGNRMLAEHCRAEARTRVTTDERSGDVYKLPPSKPDNHLWDCLVNSAVMAAAEGVSLAEHRPAKRNAGKKRRQKQRVSQLAT